MKTVSSFVLAHLGAAACAAGCSSAPGDTSESAGDAISKSAGNAPSGVAAPHAIFVRADGSFFPPVTSIQEGDSVSFVGPLAIGGGISGPGLGTTFSVVQTTRAELDLNVSCMETTRAYDITHDEPEFDNELTGPLHRGSSGILSALYIMQIEP